MPHLAQDRLALVRKLYESSELTIAEIAILADVSESAIYQRARREQWAGTRRPGVTPRKHKLRAALPPTPALAALSGPALAGDTAADFEDLDRAATAGRLWRAIDRHLQDLHAEDAPAGTIRAAQDLSALARTLQTLVDVERGLADERQARQNRIDEGPEDIDEFRNEIARRLEALLASDPE